MTKDQAINKLAESLKMMQAWQNKAEQALETIVGGGSPTIARKGKLNAEQKAKLESKFNNRVKRSLCQK